MGRAGSRRCLRLKSVDSYHSRRYLQHIGIRVGDLVMVCRGDDDLIGRVNYRHGDAALVTLESGDMMTVAVKELLVISEAERAAWLEMTKN